MAGAVEMLLDNLKQLENYHGHPRIKEKNEGIIESLKRYLCSIKGFLTGSEMKRRKKGLILEIRDVVYQVEDVIDVFVAHTISKRNRCRFSIRTRTGLFKSSNSPLQAICKKLQVVNDKITICASLTVDADDGGKTQKSMGGHGVVGFENEINVILGYLGEQTEELDVITIIGMPGIGKTTLARMVFSDERIQHEFPIRIWVRVSSVFREKDILLTILRNFITVTEDVKGKTDEELTYLVTSHLKTGKFLIVLDDMWATHDWDRLRIALPKFNNTGKLEVFGETECPPELEGLGQHISKECNGLPLAVVTMANNLLREHLSVGNDIELRKERWIKTALNIPEYRNQKFYDILPNHLKDCFLYLAVFPYDSEIPAQELIRMWIAEGFVASQDGNGASLEECAEAYLQDLIRRNLLKIGRNKAGGSANIFMEEKARLLKRDDLFKLSIYPPSSSFE
ncbi:putative late blight resistance protein R1A-3 [Salvia divinorum]|uniref:Late blight resistance protein R1A-3 n=1 Tax=Salvia divinorum TaxID=28513 RepID=A0ABD1IKN7_SALDI